MIGKKDSINLSKYKWALFLTEFHINYLIKDLRLVISLQTGIPCQEIRLIYCSKELYDNQHLNHFDIGSGSCIPIKLRIKGGMNNGTYQPIDTTQCLDK